MAVNSPSSLDPIWWNLVAKQPPIVDGTIELHEAPGRGWQLDSDHIERHRVRPFHD